MSCALLFSFKIFQSQIFFKDFTSRGMHQTPAYGHTGIGLAIPLTVLAYF